MRIKAIPFVLIIFFVIMMQPVLPADSGGSFGGYSGFDGDSGGGFDGYDSGGSSDSGTGWNSGRDTGLDYRGTGYHSGGSGGDLSWIVLLAVILIVIIIIIKTAGKGHLNSLQKAGSVLKYQVSFYGSAKEVQFELRELAGKASSYAGNMQELMREVVVMIKRHKLGIKYGNYHLFMGSSYEALQSMFRQMSSGERSKYKEELIRTGFGQQSVRREFTGQGEAKFKVAECIVVTLIVVSKKVKYPKLSVDYNNMLEILDAIAGTTDREFAGFEVIWTPENPEDAMLEEELIYKFPTLIRLI